MINSARGVGLDLLPLACSPISSLLAAAGRLSTRISLSPPSQKPCCCRMLEMLRGDAIPAPAAWCAGKSACWDILCSCPGPSGHVLIFLPPSGRPQVLNPWDLSLWAATKHQSSPAKPVCGHGLISQSSSASSSSSPGEVPFSRLKPVGYTHIISFLCGIILPCLLADYWRCLA